MFGPVVDYWLLRPLTHSRNSATEEELNARAAGNPLIDIDAELAKIQKLQQRLGGRLPISENLSYCDVGCGEGGMALALAVLGAQHVTGIDVTPRSIVTAVANRTRMQLDTRVQFICADIHSWVPPSKYDVVLSHEALEHIQEPEKFLSRLRTLIKPTGIVALAFGPLFWCPFGDHMQMFFRVPIPWRGVLFSEQAILRLRRERFRTTDKATRYQDITGSLNLMKYSAFLKTVRSLGWTFEFLEVNPQLKKLKPAYSLSRMLTSIPHVQDYVAGSVYAVLRLRQASGSK
jgi:2-polyprenyl-3-methyl-5-hydroxy-6-metoxy-1,4-benzoquinol methylase